jgi:hypothetical protein
MTAHIIPMQITAFPRHEMAQDYHSAEPTPSIMLYYEAPLVNLIRKLFSRPQPVSQY